MKHLKSSKHRSHALRQPVYIASVLVFAGIIVSTSVFATGNLEFAQTSINASDTKSTFQCSNAVVRISESAPSTVSTATLATEPISRSAVEATAESSTTSSISSEPVAETEAATEAEIYNSADVELLARLIYLEAGACSEHCQWLVGSAAMNLAGSQDNLLSVAYDYNAFNVAYEIDSCQPSSESYNIASRILSGDRDYQVKAFRTDYFHDWATPYVAMAEDNVYFSTY